MTTVAADARAGVMVCDSKCTSGDVWLPAHKVFRIGEELIGVAGDVKHWQDFLKWWGGGKRGARPKGQEYSALILRAEGLFVFDSNGCLMKIERGFHAIGSGEKAAIAVMLAGHDAETAVKLACEVDAASGGDIVTHTL